MDKVKKNLNIHSFDPNFDLQQSVDNFTQPVGSVNVEAYGRGGKLRHEGIFSSDNYYASQIPVVSNNKDMDAMYERAVETEADISKWKRENAYAREVLEEQRKYDDPAAVIARERAAGLNPDIAGGSSGGSSGSSAQQQIAPMADVSAQSKFKNAYDDSSQIVDSVNAASGIISSISGFGDTVMKGIEMSKTLSSRASLLDTQAYIADKTKDDVVAQVGQKTKLGGFDIMNNVMETVARISGLVTPESTDADISDIMNTMSVPQSSQPGMMKFVRHAQKNPTYLADWEASKKEQQELQAYNDKYTPEVLGDIMSNTLKIHRAQQAFSLDRATLSANIAKYLNTDQNAQNIADASKIGNDVALKDVKFTRDKLERDISAYVHNIAAIKGEEDRILEFEKLWKQKVRERTMNHGKLNLTQADYLVLDGLRNYREQLHILGSTEVDQLYGIAAAAASAFYINGQNFNGIGEVEPTIGIQKHQVFTGYNYRQLSNGEVTPDQFTKSLLGIIPYVGDAAGNLLTYDGNNKYNTNGYSITSF